MNQIQKQKPSLFIYLVVFFSMTPFFLPFPGLSSDLQPYALLLCGIALIMYNKSYEKNWSFLVLTPALVCSVAFLFVDGLSMNGFRAAYNHISIYFVFLALYILLNRFGYPENMIKSVFWIWFAVATIQFFVDKSFMSELISGQRESAYARGVVALCSEASFFGISCFYFLHLANKFKKGRMLYILMILIMAAFYAQSMQGILFIVIYFIGFLVESINTRKGLMTSIAVIAGAVAFYFLLNRFAPGSRLVALMNNFLNEGVMDTINGDASATNRLNSITGSLERAFEGWLIPQGYSNRIGSGFGGLLVELGVFGFLETVVIAYGFCLHFNKIQTRIIYFLLTYFILFSNTQMGNPQLLLVLAVNHYFAKQETSHETEEPNNKKILHHR